MDGVHQFNGRNYWFSWQDTNSRVSISCLTIKIEKRKHFLYQVRNTKWDWFNARNYCRKRCMDLVSFETQAEYDWVKGFVDGGTPLAFKYIALAFKK